MDTRRRLLLPPRDTVAPIGSNPRTQPTCFALSESTAPALSDHHESAVATTPASPLAAAGIILLMLGCSGDTEATGSRVRDGSAGGTVTPASMQVSPPGPIELTDSGDVPQISFETSRDGNIEIYVVGEDGLDPVNITNSPAQDRHPTWSPSRDRIAFESTRDGGHDVFVADASGGNIVNLTAALTFGGESPDWSPVTDRITFTSGRGLYVINADGTGLAELAVAPSGSMNTPRWDPTGSRIAVGVFSGADWDIFVAEGDGSRFVNVTNHSAMDDWPSWSSDGSKIAFRSFRDGGSDIFTVGVDGSNLVRLTSSASYDFFPTWSPDGSLIAFLTNRDGSHELYTMDPSGSDQRRVSYYGGDSLFRPIWSPDSSRLAVGLVGRIVVHDVAGEGAFPRLLVERPFAAGGVEAPVAWVP